MVDKKCYLWIFNNIGKYTFDADTISIKESIERLLITQDSIDSPEIIQKMESYYEQLISNFYNNIIGYRNGLSNKKITASEMDCYFVSTSDGMMPIGYCKMVRPAETVVLVQTFLEQCKRNIKQDRNAAFVDWQNGITDIADKYNIIKKNKNPSLLKAIIGMFFSIPVLLYGIVSLFGAGFYNSISFNEENANVILGNYALLDGTGKNGLIALIVLCILFIAISVVFIVNSVREILLFREKKNTIDILNNIHTYVNSIEKGTTAFSEEEMEQCFEAARKGGNVFVNKNSNANLIGEIKKKIKRASNYVNKTDKARSAVGVKTITGMIITYVLILVVVFVKLPDNDSGIITNTDNPQSNVSTDNGGQTQSEPEPEEDYAEYASNLNIYESEDIITYCYTNFPMESVEQMPSYSTYYDSDFGYKIDYPTHFEKQRSQDDINRRSYASEDGSAVLKINAGYNVGKITSQQLSDTLISTYGGDVTYNPVKDTWFAVSVNDSGDYHYAYYKLDNDEIRGFEFHFTGAENLDKYSKYIDHIYASFKKD